MFMGDETIVQVAFLGVVRLHLCTENFLELQNVVFIPSIGRNLISILDRLGYNFLLDLEKLIYIETLY